MWKLVMALVMVVIVSGVAAAETFTGLISSEFKGGDNFQQIEIDGKWHIVGCGPDSVLGDGLRAYLDDHWDKTGSVKGDAVDHPHWGFCIDNVALAEVEPEAAQPPTSSKLAEYDWLKLPEGLADDETKIVETVFTDNYWDPALRAPIRSFLGFCKYFHERGFSIKVEYDRVKEKTPTKVGDMHYVTVKMVNVAEDMALEVPLMAVSSQYMINEMRKQNGESAVRARAIVMFKYVLIAKSYKDDRWLHMDGVGWLNIIRSVINEGYVQEG
ncbi:conserved exported protein of unknown function [Pseudodesulfovibrio profundus]|uniref:Uncharacterized protein n=1 Tax=Pseudodesulfovibrio profundus TaxID=57320 RepID=A0A2C8FEB1_9BACT|nr:hypothetical protein [Pseudodesulfovibrio profundus]SOB60506.1 conserved exported protein of unknown function [Pseudodesulfovibrio profundus]